MAGRQEPMENITPLCKICYKYGSDKCPQIKHVYTPFYYKMFSKQIKQVKKVVELGIGTPSTMAHVSHYRHGASLRMWRDFFPNATVYGADIDPRSMFIEERIRTVLIDETQERDLEFLIETTGKNIDLFIDDGSHKTEHQIFTAQTLLPLLSKETIYIIEDVANPRSIANALSEYNCVWPHLEGRRYKKGRLMVIRK